MFVQTFSSSDSRAILFSRLFVADLLFRAFRVSFLFFSSGVSFETKSEKLSILK